MDSLRRLIMENIPIWKVNKNTSMPCTPHCPDCIINLGNIIRKKKMEMSMMVFRNTFCSVDVTNFYFKCVACDLKNWRAKKSQIDVRKSNIPVQISCQQCPRLKLIHVSKGPRVLNFIKNAVKTCSECLHLFYLLQIRLFDDCRQCK